MRLIAKAVLLAVFTAHGILHLFGGLEGLAGDMTPLPNTIGPVVGVLWLVVGVLILGSSVSWALHRRWWWVMAASAGVSQALVISAWDAAWAGTVPNALLALVAWYGWKAYGRGSPRHRYELLKQARQAAAAACEATEQRGVIERRDLDVLPPPVATYLRRTGCLGTPRVAGFTARLHGRIRDDAKGAWMPFVGEQTNTYLPEVSRVFWLDATKAGLPVAVLHEYTGAHATMRAQLASCLTVADAAGPEMDRAETVTLLNDMCFMAPAALLDADVTWQPIDERRVGVEYTNAGHTVTAELEFDEAGDLIDFHSPDRYRAVPGGQLERQGWSTPLDTYRLFDGHRLASHGTGDWHPPQPEGRFSYIELHLDDITYVPLPSITDSRLPTG